MKSDQYVLTLSPDERGLLLGILQDAVRSQRRHIDYLGRMRDAVGDDTIRSASEIAIAREDLLERVRAS